MKRILITVREQKGKCVAGHKVGDKFLFDGMKLDGFICLSAFSVLYRYVYAMMHGAQFPWEAKGRSTVIACPDPRNPVVFELDRVEKET